MSDHRRADSVLKHLLCIGSLLLVLEGCQRGPAIPTSIPVSGKITYQGKPVGKASLTLLNNDPKGKNATGITNDAGEFTLQTYFDPEHLLKGAIVGDYCLTVTKTEEFSMPVLDSAATDKGPAMSSSSADAKKFAQAMAEASKPKKSLIPKKYGDAKTTKIKVTVEKGIAPLDIELKDD